MKIGQFTFLVVFFFSSFSNNPCYCQQESTIDLIDLSRNLLEDAYGKKDVSTFLAQLETLPLSEFVEQLNTDKKKKSFWINIYNAFIKIHLSENPRYYDDRRSFFKLPLIPIAQEKMSFAQIEHGILRRSQLEYFLGYITNPFPSKREKSLRVDERDFRIHFALNCGAKSCPPVAIYSAEHLDNELDKMAMAFLQKFSTHDIDENIVTTTSLFAWFKGDFNGGKGIREILVKYKICPTTDVRVNTSPYDWTLDVENYLGSNF